MQKQLEEICTKALNEVENAVTSADIDNIKLEYLSRKSVLNNIKKGLKDLTPEQRPIVGAFANEVAQKIEQAVCEKEKTIYEKELNEKLEAQRIDITLPGRVVPMGKIHPLTATIEEIVGIFQGMGFTITDNSNSPEVETEYYNFDALNFPKDHPAKDMQDTFYTKVAPNVILRGQTSGAQIHTMEEKKPPLRIISPGRVYRCESVSARKNNLFHQIEGLVVDKNITFADLKGTLNEFTRIYFGEARPTRFRTSFFPFTEPSAEIDVQCIMCKGKGCRVCSQTGWLEILGAGMVDPNVLKGVGIDPEVYTGFAFGMGVERLAMLKHAISDIRMFFNNDIRFLEQF